MLNGWSDLHQIWYICADSSGNGYTPNKLPQETQGGTWGGGFRGSNIQKSREAAKLLNRLAPTLVHVGGFIWEYKYKSPLNTPGGMAGGGGELGGHKFKSIGKLSNGWTDWHQIWYTCVDSSGNGHRLKTIRPTIPRGDILGGFMRSTIQNTGKCGQTAGPIVNKCCTSKMQMNLGKDTG